MHILTNDLIKKYDTRDPIELAECLDIRVIHEDLGMINGYYNEIKNFKFIHINSNLPDEQQIFTAAHELGHALLHERTNVAFFNSFTNMNTAKFEHEANLFATFLLISDEVVEEYKHFSVPKLMEIYGLSEQLIIERFFAVQDET